MEKRSITEYFNGNYLPFYQQYVPSITAKGKEYWACCPFHDEKTPSFAFRGETGEFFCQGCKTGGDIFTYYAKQNGLDVKADFLKVINGIANDFSISNGQGRVKTDIVKTYDYTDATGKLLFQVCRMEPKDFRQRRPDGNGDWIWKTKGVKPVLYHLPEVIRADEVLIVEGEKDADSLSELGFMATTNPGGAEKWRDDYSEYLKGKQVVIIPDNDEPGHKHAAQVARSLAGISSSIKVINLPDLPAKGDVTDFIKNFKDPEEAAERLSIIIDGAEPYTPDAEKEPEQECFLEALSESDDDSGSEYEWFIEKLVPKGEPMVIGGKGGSGKSTLALEFSAQIMEADPDAAVVYVCAEGTYRDTKVRARQMGLYQFGRFFFLKRKGGGTSFKLSDKTELELLASTLRQAKKKGLKIAVVVIDSIRGMQKGSLSDDAVGEVMQAINSEVCQILGATVSYIHHSKKNIQDITAMDALLGSVYIVNSVRHALFIKKDSNRVRTVEICKSNLGFEDHYFRAEMGDNKRVNLKYQGLLGDDDSGVDDSQLGRAEEIILSMLANGEKVPAYQIYERGKAEGISAETIKRAKKLHHIYSKKIGKCWKWWLESEK